MKTIVDSQLEQMAYPQQLTKDWLVSVLAQDSLITEHTATKLQAKQAFADQSPIAWLATQQLYNNLAGHIFTQADISKYLADKLGYKYLAVDLKKINYEQLKQLCNLNFAQDNQILLIEESKDRLTVGCVDPFIPDWENKLAIICGKKVEKCLINPDTLKAGLANYGLQIAQATSSESEYTGDNLISPNQERLSLEQMVKNTSAGNNQAQDIANYILNYALENNISDIHFHPRNNSCAVRLRADGYLFDFHTLPEEVFKLVLSSIKVKANLDITEHRLAQDGRFSFTTATGKQELRASSLPTMFGEKLVVRILGTSEKLTNFSQLGLNDQQSQAWQKLISQPSGLILVTGPTGSGKSASLHLSLGSMDATKYNICTIEDPIENLEASFSQTQVHPSIGLTFAAGLKALLRQDPDIIMIGEIRDLETAEIALRSSLTGHLVLSTLHTNDAVSAITRLLDIGIESYLIKDTLTAVLSQRLVRKLCLHCCSLQEISSTESDLLHQLGIVKQPEQIMQAVGCQECRGTGYIGRTGLFELLVMEDNIRELLGDTLDTAQVLDVARKNGMQSLLEHGVSKVLEGVTTLEEVLTAANLQAHIQ